MDDKHSLTGNMEGNNQNLPYDYDEYDENNSEPEFHHEEMSVGSNAAKGKKRRSTPSVWPFLTRFDAPLDDGTIYPYARCNTCGRELAADTKHNGTSNLWWHLMRCPGSPLYEPMVVQLAPTPAPAPTPTPTSTPTSTSGRPSLPRSCR